MNFIPAMKRYACKHCAVAFVALVVIVALLGTLSVAQSGVTQNVRQTKATRIVTDHDSGSFIFISKGEPIARLDENGLHVVGDVIYGGLLIDKNEAVREALAGNAESSGTKEE